MFINLCNLLKIITITKHKLNKTKTFINFKYLYLVWQQDIEKLEDGETRW
jgi:hypothetical protein